MGHSISFIRQFLSITFALLVAFASTAYAADEAEVSKIEAQSMSTLININTADAETLASGIKGIGKKKAIAIVAYREANGDFESVDELANVKGIGQKTVEKNRAKLSVN